MKSLFNERDSNEIINRISTLTSEIKPQWGKMSAAQMMAHVQMPLKVAVGEVKLKRGLIGILFGRIAKNKLAGEVPFSRNLPTDKNFIIRNQPGFEEERQLLVSIVRRFQQLGPDGLSKEPHPFFGKLTVQEWDNLMWKHLDHHLRQFSV